MKALVAAGFAVASLGGAFVDGGARAGCCTRYYVDLGPQWAPDGARIAFTRVGYGSAAPDSGVYVIGADGSNLRPLATGLHGGEGREPTWSPDGRRIAFGGELLQVIDADGTRLRRLTSPARGTAYSPVWSPDGRKIAFLRSFSSLWVIDADGTGVRLLARSVPFTPCDCNPPYAWSPDSDRLAFAAVTAGVTDLWTIRPDGSGRRRLLRTATRDLGPVWSPDGSHIAFEGSRRGQSDVYVLNPASRALTNLTRHPAFDGSPSFSPDGRRVAFISGRDSPRIAMATVDEPGVATTIFSDRLGMGRPAWSHDGTRLTVIAGRECGVRTAVYVLDLTATTPARRLTNLCS